MNFKSLVLGAAGIVAASGAFAADLPVAPEPVDYVRVCDAYGTGFFYIPGTETCLRVGGRVRVDFRAFGHGDDGPYAGPPAGWVGPFDLDFFDDHRETATATRARGYLRLDSRTATEFGLLRTYMDVWFTNTSGATNRLTLWDAFIQLGGLTVGHTTSFFDFWTGNVYEAYFDQSNSDQKTTLLGYTAAFGNGFSASLSLEDGTYRRSFIAGPFGAYGGHWWPDLVANLRVDQGWGSAQVMGAIHDVRDGSFAVDDSETGWAIGAGVIVNLPMLAPGDNVAFQAAYSEGAVSYATPSVADGFGVADAIRRPGGALDLTEAWSVGGGFTHFWTPSVSSSFTATYVDINFTDPGDVAPDLVEWDLQGNIVWSPVAGFEIGGELDYHWTDPDGANNDFDALVGVLRFQRTF